MLLEVPDPVLLDGQGPVELHLTEPTLEGVQRPHQFDQGVAGRCGHQGRYGARARGLGWAAALPLGPLGE